MLCILHYEDWDNAASYAFCSRGAKQCDILAGDTNAILILKVFHLKLTLIYSQI